jgi:hypothetical protein
MRQPWQSNDQRPRPLLPTDPGSGTLWRPVQNRRGPFHEMTFISQPGDPILEQIGVFPSPPGDHTQGSGRLCRGAQAPYWYLRRLRSFATRRDRTHQLTIASRGLLTTSTLIVDHRPVVVCGWPLPSTRRCAISRQGSRLLASICQGRPESLCNQVCMAT